MDGFQHLEVCFKILRERKVIFCSFVQNLNQATSLEIELNRQMHNSILLAFIKTSLEFGTKITITT